MSDATTAASVDEGDEEMASTAAAPLLSMASESDGMRAVGGDSRRPCSN